MKILKYFLLILIISSYSCRKKDFNNPLDDWFKDPPVSPITQTIKTVIPVGYAASVAMLSLKGFNVPNTKVVKEKDVTLIYIDTETSYPFKFKGDDYGQIIVAAVKTDDNTALISVFFTEMNVVTGSFKLQNVIAFPAIYTSEKITAVFVSMDINIGSNSNVGMELTQSEMESKLLKLNNERTSSSLDGVKIAIAQNAWIIDIYHKGTYDNFYDDEYKINGGQQAVNVEDFDTESSAGVLQMAMVDADFSYDCLKNPSHGYVFMQDVEVASTNNSSDIVFGHVFYEFHPSCDGDILVDIATGNFLFAIGKEIDLGLN